MGFAENVNMKPPRGSLYPLGGAFLGFIFYESRSI
jgi:hypothetical protein